MRSRRSNNRRGGRAGGGKWVGKVGWAVDVWTQDRSSVYLSVLSLFLASPYSFFIAFFAFPLSTEMSGNSWKDQ